MRKVFTWFSSTLTYSMSSFLIAFSVRFYSGKILVLSIQYVVVKRIGPHLSRFSTWRIYSREQANLSECDWLVMSSVFVASQSSCFFLCSREQIRLVENWLYTRDAVYVWTNLGSVSSTVKIDVYCKRQTSNISR